MQPTHTDPEMTVRHIRVLLLLTEGPLSDETPAAFGHRVSETAGEQAYELVMERIRTGQYPPTDSDDWPTWADRAVFALSHGQEPSGVVRYACGASLGDGWRTCGLDRGHTDPVRHQERY